MVELRALRFAGPMWVQGLRSRVESFRSHSLGFNPVIAGHASGTFLVATRYALAWRYVLLILKIMHDLSVL